MVDSLLEKVIGLDYKLKGGGQRWRNTEQHSSLVLDLQEGAFFWNSRGISGRPIDYLTKVKGLSRKQAEELINDLSGISSVSKPHKGEISTPNEKLVKVFWENGKNDRDYWYRRCLKDSTIDSFRLGKYDSFFTIPIYYKDNFINFQCRKDTPKKVILPWYRGVGTLLFNSSILQLVDKVFITEGPVDAILLNQNGFPAISHTGGSTGFPTKTFSDFSRCNIIYYVADNDVAGLNGARLVANCLGTQRVKIILFGNGIEKYDSVDFFRDGHGVDDFEKLIDNSKFIFEIKKDLFDGRK